MLELFLTEIIIPMPQTMDQPKQKKRPRLRSPGQTEERNENLVFGPKPSATPKTVSFPPTLLPESPGSA